MKTEKRGLRGDGYTCQDPVRPISEPGNTMSDDARQPVPKDFNISFVDSSLKKSISQVEAE